MHCLLVLDTGPSLVSLSLCPFLPPRVCPMFVRTSHFTVCWSCVTMRNAVFYSLCCVWYYFTQCRLKFMCHYVHYCPLHSFHCLSVPHTAPSVGSVSLPSMLSSEFCPISVITSHVTVCWFCVSISTDAFKHLSTVCHHVTMYPLLSLWQSINRCFLESVHCLSGPHIKRYVGFFHYNHCCLLYSFHCLSLHLRAPSVVSVSLIPLLPSRIPTLSVIP